MQKPINEIKDHSVKKIYLKKPHAEFFCVHLTAEVNTCTCNKKNPIMFNLDVEISTDTVILIH